MKKQPNSLHCFVCGIENPIGLNLKFYEVEDGIIETTFIAPEHLQGYPGILHGGIAASILDETSGRALMGDPSSPRFMFTGKLEIRYRKNIPIGKPLRIVGKSIKSRKKTAEGWAGIYNDKGELLAEANALLIDMPHSLLSQSDRDTLGWKVYPD